MDGGGERAAGLPRAHGTLSLSIASDGARSRLVDLGQSGCLRLRFPRAEPGAPLEAVTVNISGGVVAGDHLDASFACGAGASLCVSSQAAERFYRARSNDPPAHVRTTLTVAPGGSLEWLPQESILFDGVRLRRTLDVAMSSQSRVLAVESQIFGRRARGETLQTLSLRDRMRVVRDGRVVFDNILRWEGEVGAALARPALAACAASVATILLASSGAARWLEPVRMVLAEHADPAVSVAASSWNDLLVVRMMSQHDGQHRTMLTRLLCVLRDDAPMPRVWQT
jgi:urease accessory protein